MQRNPRGTCPRPSSRGGPPAAGGATAVAGACAPRYKKPVGVSTIPKRGPPPTCPKKVDYKKPQMTKAMMQRLKHAEKFREEMERKERERAEASQLRRPKRTAAPPGGDARMRGRCPAPRAKSKEPPSCPAGESSSRPPSRGAPCPAPRGKSAPPSGAAAVPARTRTLAASMNADIVQAEPLQVGPIDNVIIPPGTINSERTTIVSIPQQQQQQQQPQQSCTPLQSSTMQPGSSAANRSIRVIAETLDEQVMRVEWVVRLTARVVSYFVGRALGEIVRSTGFVKGLEDESESAVVNSKLQDLQQARRDFVMAVANVGGNAINLQDDDLANVTPIADITPPYLGSPEPPSPRMYRCPSIENAYFVPEYAVDDPGAEARRQYLRERGKYVDPFAQLHPQADATEEYIEPPENLPPGMFDDDDACPHGPHGPGTFGVPRRDPYEYLPCDVERIERFFDLEHFPPQPCPERSPRPREGPPPGRECLPQDLWELEDPWFIEAEDPDLIQF